MMNVIQRVQKNEDARDPVPEQRHAALIATVARQSKIRWVVIKLACVVATFCEFLHGHRQAGHRAAALWMCVLQLNSGRPDVFRLQQSSWDCAKSTTKKSSKVRVDAGRCLRELYSA